MAFLTIFSGVLGLIGFLILPETYAPRLLRREPQDYPKLPVPITYLEWTKERI